MKTSISFPFHLQKVVKAMGKSWHEDHFVCGGPCKKPMSGTPFFEREGKPYCKADFEKLFAAKCEGCKNPITENTVIALNAKWHKDCFKCKVTVFNFDALLIRIQWTTRIIIHFYQRWIGHSAHIENWEWKFTVWNLWMRSMQAPSASLNPFAKNYDKKSWFRSHSVFPVQMVRNRVKNSLAQGPNQTAFCFRVLWIGLLIKWSMRRSLRVTRSKINKCGCLQLWIHSSNVIGIRRNLSN